jgi:hypothetical protein
MPRDKGRALSALAKNTGSVERWRKVNDGAQLLWLCFLDAQCFVSLRVVAGLSLGFGELKESSVAHRLKKAPAFLGEILVHVLGFHGCALHDGWQGSRLTLCGLWLPRRVQFQEVSAPTGDFMQSMSQESDWYALT